jgi:hypothetical protein
LITLTMTRWMRSSQVARIRLLRSENLGMTGSLVNVRP